MCAAGGADFSVAQLCLCVREIGMLRESEAGRECVCV